MDGKRSDAAELTTDDTHRPIETLSSPGAERPV